MFSHRGLAAVSAILGLAPSLYAGPYSSGTANTTPAAPDPAIAGFVGPDGEGLVTANNAVNPVFTAWATSVASYTPAVSSTQTLDSIWKDPAAALGSVTGDYTNVVSLGELTASDLSSGATPGQITLSFSSGIRNGAGPDFAAFENGLGSNSSLFVELAYVEVSSNGSDFARFAPVSLTASAVGAFGQMDPTAVYNLAGKHANGNGKSWGTPFDLADLASHPLVTSALVNLDDIRYVRFVDIPGTGAFTDSLGNPIYDPNPTTGSGGFDLEAVGVINSVPEPASMALLTGAMVLLTRRARR